MRKILIPFILALALLLFLMVNVYASQVFDPLLFRLMQNKDTESAREFLGHIEGTEYHEQQFEYLNSVHNDKLRNYEEANEYSTRQSIANFEILLEKNPKSRDVLIKLALLHLEVREQDRARNYYLQAKSVDPWITIEDLEALF